MALKDWTTRINNLDKWMNKNSGVILYIAEDIFGYYIQVQSEQFGIFRNPFGRVYNSNKIALKFAKQYMRKN